MKKEQRMELAQMPGNVEVSMERSEERFLSSQRQRLFSELGRPEEGDILEIANSKLREMVRNDDSEREMAETTLNEFLEAKNAGRPAHVKFSSYSRERMVMSDVYNGVSLVLDTRSLAELPSVAENPGIFAKYLGIPMVVDIREVDFEKKTVTFGFREKDKRIFLTGDKERLKKRLVADFDDKTTPNPVIFGQVISVYQNSVVVNIGQAGVIGKCWIAEWKKGYTRDLTVEVRKGDVLPFEIISRPEGRKYDFNLSRVRLAGDPCMDAMEDDTCQVGDEILVKCVQIPDKSENDRIPVWWGRTELLPGVEISGDYTEKFAFGQNRIIEGITYMCKVRKKYVDAKGVGRVVVAPFRVRQEDFATWSRLTSLKSGKMKEITFN